MCLRGHCNKNDIMPTYCKHVDLNKIKATALRNSLNTKKIVTNYISITLSLFFFMIDNKHSGAVAAFEALAAPATPRRPLLTSRTSPYASSLTCNTWRWLASSSRLREPRPRWNARCTTTPRRNCRRTCSRKSGRRRYTRRNWTRAWRFPVRTTTWSPFRSATRRATTNCSTYSFNNKILLQWMSVNDAKHKNWLGLERIKSQATSFFFFYRFSLIHYQTFIKNVYPVSFRLLFTVHRSSDWHLLVIDGVSAVLLSERTYVPILSDRKTADTPFTTSQRQSDETCSKQ